MILFALDANIVIHAFQGKGGVLERLRAVPPSRVAIPAVALFEVERGVLGSRNSDKRRKQLDALVAACGVLDFDARAASAAARLLLSLEKKGQQIGPLDTLIAATALAHGATLVTHNSREFRRVAGLQVEDRYSS